MTNPDFGMGGVAKLAVVGYVAICALMVVVPIGAIAAIVWVWRHVSVTAQ